MNNKNLITQVKNSGNRIFEKDLSAEMLELSGKELQQVVGGQLPRNSGVKTQEPPPEEGPVT